MRRLALAAAGAAAGLLPITAFAADQEGNFAVKGAGVASCENYSQARQEKSNLYFRFGGWMEGYLTAINEHREQTYDVAPWETTELLAALVDQHCQQNPDQNFASVIRAMTGALFDDRLLNRSELREVTVGGNTVRMYEATIRRIQEELAVEGFYDGPVDGDYGPGTQSAMQAFQESIGAPEPTGFPDQVSLLRLFAEEGEGQPLQPQQ